jgi:hypothetical protein
MHDVLRLRRYWRRPPTEHVVDDRDHVVVAMRGPGCLFHGIQPALGPFANSGKFMVHHGIIIGGGRRFLNRCLARSDLGVFLRARHRCFKPTRTRMAADILA